MPEPLWGKYVGIVEQNIDPAGRGRLQLSFPALELGTASWAEVSLSAPEARRIDDYVPPPIGAEVWVEFERGDPRYPICTGCRWPG